MNTRSTDNLGGNPIDESLVSYLDGEMGADESRDVESRLATDEPFRDRLHGLDQAWELLDELPRTEVENAFTQTTIQMVTVAAQQDLLVAGQKEKRRKGLLLIGSACVLAASFVAGYFGMNRVAPNLDRQDQQDRELADKMKKAEVVATENQQIVDDLFILENYDSYRQTADVGIEFLEMLVDENVFPEEIDVDY